MRLATILSIFSLIAGVAHAQNPAAKLTLEQAFAQALQNSETMQIQKVLIEQSDNTLTQSRSQLAPSFNALASRTQQGRDTGGGDITVTDSTLTRVGISQPIFKGGIITTGIDLAKVNQEKARVGAEEATRQLWWAVTQLYYRILAADRDLKNLEEQDRVLGRRQTEVSRRVQLGRSRNSNLQSTLSQRSSVQAQIQSIKTDLSIAKLNLAQVMGVSDVGELAAPAQPVMQKETPLKQRADIRLQELSLESAKLGVDLVKGNLWPELSLTANYYPYRFDSVASFQNATKWDAGLALTWNLDWAEINQSQKRDRLYVQNIEELKQKQIERISREELVRKEALRKGLDSRSRELDRAVDSSEKALKATQGDFRAGTADFLDVVTAEDSYWALKRQADALSYQKDLLAWEVLWLRGIEPSRTDITTSAATSNEVRR